MRKVIEHCPACSGELVITGLRCTRCDTEVRGRFAITPFDRLPPDSLAFAALFVRLRGNVREMERELGVPYSAVRNRLDEVIRQLGFDDPGGSAQEPAGRPQAAPSARRRVLERLERGQIDPAQAAVELESLNQQGGAP